MSNVAKANTSGRQDQLTKLAYNLLKGTAPVRQELLGQQLEALRTGGVGARVPIIQRAVESSRQATGDAYRAQEGQLAEHNLAGTVFGQRLLGETKRGGDQATSRIPTDYASSIIQGIPSFISQLTSLASGSLGHAANLDFGTQTFNADQTKAFMEDLKSSIISGSTAGAGSGAA